MLRTVRNFWRVARAALPAVWVVVWCAGTARSAPATNPATADPAQVAFFEAKVRPVLAESCYKCHSAKSEKLKGKLRLDSRDAILKGGDSGPAVVPGDPEKSRLIEAVRYGDEDTAMPPKGRLPASAVKDLETWVKMGAPWPAEQGAVAAAQEGPGGKVDYEKLRREHWAYQPIRKSEPPAVKDAAWPRNDIDRFVLAGLEAKGLQPAADADRAVLVRRLYFDLIGLPPTPEEIDAFRRTTARPTPTSSWSTACSRRPTSASAGAGTGSTSPASASRSPSAGSSSRTPGATATTSSTPSTPTGPSTASSRSRSPATCCPPSSVEADAAGSWSPPPSWPSGNTNLEEQDKKQLGMDVVDEQLDTIGKAFLAQTIGCARCHDHKFDPIPTSDYYALAGILRSTRTLEHANVSQVARGAAARRRPSARRR